MEQKQGVEKKNEEYVQWTDAGGSGPGVQACCG